MCNIGWSYARSRCVPLSTQRVRIEEEKNTSIREHDTYFRFCISQYLEENVHQTYVDVGVMARHLQEKYREYTRRKSHPFRLLVDQGKRTLIGRTFDTIHEKFPVPRHASTLLDISLKFDINSQLTRQCCTATAWTAIRLQRTTKIQTLN